MRFSILLGSLIVANAINKDMVKVNDLFFAAILVAAVIVDVIEFSLKG